MKHGTGGIARTLAAAAVIAAVAVSCPNPIDDELLLLVDDEIAPDLTIVGPSANSYYHGIMQVAGTLSDSSSETGDGQGRMRTLSFTVSDESPLARTVTFDAAGNATVTPADPSFDWDPAIGSFSFELSTTGVQGYKVLTFIAVDVNGNETRRDVGLLPYPYGPHLVLTNPVDLSIYGLVVTVEGTATNSATDGATGEITALECTATQLPTHELAIGPATLQPDGTYQSGSLVFDPSTGQFSDWFDTHLSSGSLIVRVRAQNASQVWSSVTVQLVYNDTGPAITLSPAAPGHNPTDYSSVVTTAVIIDGTVDTTNLKPGSMYYLVLQPSGRPQSGGIAPDPAGQFSFTFNPSSGDPSLSGNLTIEVHARDNRDVESVASHICFDDTDPPVAPNVTGVSPTKDPPTWTWNTPEDAVGFRYSLDSGTGPWTPCAGTSWTAPTGTEGDYTLYVQARDALGNWSASGSFTVTVDTTPPAAPTVTSEAQYTADQTPTWWWNTPAQTVEFRYSPLNSPDPGPTGWTLTTDTSWTQPVPLEDGSYTLYVQGRDAAGNWSVSGSFEVVVDHD